MIASSEIPFGHELSIALSAFLDARELVVPVAFKSAGPFVERSDLWSVRAIEDLAAVTAYIDQADVAQDPEVFGDGRLREAQRDNDVADGMFPGREKLREKNRGPLIRRKLTISGHHGGRALQVIEHQLAMVAQSLPRSVARVRARLISSRKHSKQRALFRSARTALAFRSWHAPDKC